MNYELAKQLKYEKYKPKFRASNKPFDGKWLYELLCGKPYVKKEIICKTK